VNPVIAAAIAQAIAALVEIWRTNANKPPGWEPSDAEWTAMLALNEKSAAQYKQEAADLLGIPWPPQ